MNIDGKPLTAKQREHHHYLIDAMARIDYDLHNRIFINQRVPSDWVRIATSPSPAKKRVTIRLDEDVLKFFRSMGPDYGPRMNDVLKAFMRARLMGLLHGDETIDQFKEQEKSGPHKRPKWVWTDQMMEEGDAWLKTRRGRSEGGRLVMPPPRGIKAKPPRDRRPAPRGGDWLGLAQQLGCAEVER